MGSSVGKPRYDIPDDVPYQATPAAVRDRDHTGIIGVRAIERDTRTIGTQTHQTQPRSIRDQTIDIRDVSRSVDPRVPTTVLGSDERQCITDPERSAEREPVALDRTHVIPYVVGHVGLGEISNTRATDSRAHEPAGGAEFTTFHP